MRDSRGKFIKGNQAAKGHKNRTAQKRAKLSDEFLRNIRVVDIGKVSKKLVSQAEAGDLQAIRELLDRAIGKPQILETEAEPLRIEVSFPPELSDI